MQGLSLLPLIRDDFVIWRTDSFIEHSWTLPPQYTIPKHESLRNERFKYIHYTEQMIEELYDLDADPGELHDLVDERPNEATRMRLKLWMLIDPDTPLFATATDERPAELDEEAKKKLKALGY